MKLLLVSGPWGSGTTAVAGLLDRLGAVGFGPYFMSNDPRTPNTYEFLPFMDLVRRYVSVSTLSYRESRPGDLEAELRTLRSRIERQEFGAYDPASGPPIFLKYPPSAFVLPQICDTFDVKLISVIRPLRQIEQTRLRRGWPPEFGKRGAEVIYRHMSRVLNAHLHPHMKIKYEELLRSPLEVAQRLVQFAELGAGPERIEAAARFVQRASPQFAQVSRNAAP